MDNCSGSSFSLEAPPSSDGWGGEYGGRGFVASVRPKSEWLANNALVIVLALLAAQQAYFNFNGTTTTDIAVLKEQVRGVMATRCAR